jgi:5S rRNA maturation endonuclease (ribonuclease M5)
MPTGRNKLTAILITTVLLVFAAVIATAAQKASVPKPQNRVALAEDQVKHLLLLMDADKTGKISKQQFMQFMEAEFERLDTAKKGELDVKQLTTQTVTAKNYVGK